MHRHVSTAWLALGATAFAQDDELGSRSDGVCCGTECCLIEGECFARNEENPRNSCEICNPDESQAAFTAVAGCTPPDAGGGGGGGGDDDGGCSIGTGAASAGVPLFSAALALVFFAVRRRR